jgi:hypothetical protein
MHVALTPSAGDGSSTSAARSLVDAFLAEMPLWQEWHGNASTIIEVGDAEDQFALATRKGIVTFETISRGHRYLAAQFAQELDGWRILIMELGKFGGRTNECPTSTPVLWRRTPRCSVSARIIASAGREEKPHFTPTSTRFPLAG